MVDDDAQTYRIKGVAFSQKRFRNGSAITEFSIANSVTSSVWSLTITDTTGDGVIAGFIDTKLQLISSGTDTIVLTSYAGTDANPKTVYVYLKESATPNVMELVASNTNPEGTVDHINVAVFKAGTVGTSSVTLYSELAQTVTGTNLVHQTYTRFYDEGTIYQSGMDITSTASNVSIATGNVKVIYTNYTSTAVNVVTDSLFVVQNAGTYVTQNDFDFAQYSSGETITANKFFNVVIGILVNGSTNIMALVQGKPTTEYNTFASAKVDEDNTYISTPTDPVLKRLFIPIAHIIVQKTGTGVLQPYGGSYHIDLRGTQGTGGGSGGTTGFWSQSGSTLSPITSGDGILLSGSATLDLNSTTAVSSILDEDNMVSDSATALCTQQSIKAYVDAGTGAAGVWQQSGGEVTLKASTSDIVVAQNLTLESTTNTSMINNRNASTNTALITFKTGVTDDWTVGLQASTSNYRIYNSNTSTSVVSIASTDNDIFLDSPQLYINPDSGSAQLKVLSADNDSNIDLIRPSTTYASTTSLVTSTTTKWEIGMRGGDSHYSVYNNATTNTALYIDTTNDNAYFNTSKVEIAPTTGTSALQITSADGNSQLFLNRDSFSDQALIYLRNGTSTNWQIGTAAGGTDFTIYNDVIAGGEYAMRFSATANVTYLYGVYDNNITTRAVNISSAGELGTDTSLRAHKMNIVDIDETSWLYTLRPRKFNRRLKLKDRTYSDTPMPYIEYGFIAEEVESVHKPMCDYNYTYTFDENGDPNSFTESDLYSIKMRELPAVIIKEMQRRNEAIVVNDDNTISLPHTYSHEVTSTPRDLAIDADGVVGYLPSVRASKKNINYTRDYSWIFHLKPVTFNYRKKKNGKYTEETHKDTEYGLIAEDVEKLNKDLCIYEGKELKGVNYRKLVVPLVATVHDLKDRNAYLSKKLEIMNQTLQKHVSLISALNTRMSMIEFCSEKKK
jgi:hypothetical protein